MNELIITARGDSLEHGFWTYNIGGNGVISSGNYEDGYKVNHWIYKTGKDSLSVTWRIINNNGIKFNVPDYLKLIEKVEPPTLFHFDIPDSDDNTYLVSLRYNLSDLNASVYDYLYQYNQSWKDISSVQVKSKEFKKFTFKGIEIFRVKIVSEGEKKYEAISYIFIVKNYLYDLTYKNTLSEISALDLEVFSDILYSMECDDVDLFNYNNRTYLKEEDVVFNDEHNEGS